MNDVKRLKRAIRAVHGCNSKHLQTYLVHEQMDGKTVWEGDVEEFELIQCPEAKNAFAWHYQDGADIRSVIVLKLPPVQTARDAVQVAILSGEQK